MLRHVALVLLLCAFASPVLADDSVSVVPVHFAPGKTGTVLKGVIKGRQSISYTLGAEAGQTITLRLISPQAATSFNLYAPGKKPGDEALVIGELNDNQFHGALPQSGTYTLNVFLNRAAARRGQSSRFTLDVAIVAPFDPASVVKNDFADGLQGGPDFWRVASQRQKSIRLYREPSQQSGVVASLAQQEIVRNHGCRMVQGVRWCQVERVTKPQSVGWVEGAFLRESAAPQDSLVAGTKFHATGEIPCAWNKGQPTVPCRFGVVRHGLGRADVTVFFPDGQTRIIRFDNNMPAGSDAPDGARLSFSKQQDLFLISINAARFEIPEAVINGG